MNYVTFSYGNMRTDILLFQSKKDLYSMKKTYGNKTQYVSFFVVVIFLLLEFSVVITVTKPLHHVYAKTNGRKSANFKNNLTASQGLWLNH